MFIFPAYLFKNRKLSIHYVIYDALCVVYVICDIAGLRSVPNKVTAWIEHLLPV